MKGSKLARGISHAEPTESRKEVSEQNLMRGVFYESEEKEKPLIKGVFYESEEKEKPLIKGVFYESEEKEKPLIKGVFYESEEKEKSLTKGMTYELEAKKEKYNTVAVIENPTTGILFQPEPPFFNPAEVVCSGVVKEGQEEAPIQSIEATGSLNFDLVLQRRIVKITDTENGESREYRYQIGIIIKVGKNQQYYSAVVDSDKVKGLDWLKKATHSLATLPDGREERIEYAKKVQRCIETEKAEIELIYPNAGWRNIPDIGWRYVYGGGVIGDDKPLIHADAGRYRMDILQNEVGTVEVFNKAMAMTEICRSGITSLALFLFLHASLLSTIFKEAGHSLNFVFGIAGVTNSRKTSLVLAMMKIFDLENMVADAEFATATACGIEKTLGAYKDGVVIIDDFKPGATIAQQRKMDEKLDELVRYYGNRVPKKRMLDFTADEKKKFFPINGGCVMTMEIVTGVLSSMTRMFISEIGNQEVDNEKLTFYQREKYILSTHVYDFISWATNRFEQLREYIQQQFCQLRTEQRFKVPRYNEMYATFLTSAFILARYAAERGYWESIQCQAFLEDVQRKITAELNNMEMRIKSKDKGAIIVQAFCEALKNGTLVSKCLNNDTAAQCHVLYEDKLHFYIQCRELRKIANEFCASYGLNTSIVNEDELIGLLERLDMIAIYESGTRRERSRKLPCQKGNHCRYLWIKKEVLLQFEQQ